MKNLTNKELLDVLPICDIGQITKKQRAFLSREVKKGNVEKTLWFWNSMCIGNKKTWYY